VAGERISDALPRWPSVDVSVPQRTRLEHLLQLRLQGRLLADLQLHEPKEVPAVSGLLRHPHLLWIVPHAVGVWQPDLLQHEFLLSCLSSCGELWQSANHRPLRPQQLHEYRMLMNLTLPFLIALLAGVGASWSP
jgi:hypothetical protein